MRKSCLGSFLLFLGAVGLQGEFLQAGESTDSLLLSVPLSVLPHWQTSRTDELLAPLNIQPKNKNKLPWSPEQLNAARFLFSRLQNRQIGVKKTLPTLLAKVPVSQRSAFCYQCLQYFLHTAPEVVRNTGG